jgi:sialic acid synthase SpsE
MNLEKPYIEFDGITIGPGHSCVVIAEAGLNHNGDLEIAKRLIDMAVICGADIVKFQKRTVDILAIQSVLDAKDTRFPEFGETYRQIREHHEFSLDEYALLKKYCEERKIAFLCTAFDIEAVDFLERLEVTAYKVASHSLTNLPLLEYLAKIGKPVILSTGMAQQDEVDSAVEVFNIKDSPLALLHCVSSYPQSAEESNLAMINKLRDHYHLPVGYSGHELGYLPTSVAVALGADIVERHITLDKELIGFDHKLSLEPAELFSMIRDIRTIEKTMGVDEKNVSETERVTRNKYHVSLVAAVDIHGGQEITESVLTLKNPGTGIPYKRINEVIGKVARDLIPVDTLIDFSMFD